MGFGLAFGRPISKSFGFISLQRRASPPQAYEKIAIYTFFGGNLYINSDSRWEKDAVETELHKSNSNGSWSIDRRQKWPNSPSNLLQLMRAMGLVGGPSERTGSN